MGYYYVPGGGPTPPEHPRWWHRLVRYIPEPIKNWWADMVEVSAVTRVVFSVLAPILGLMFAFVLFCTAAVLLYSFLVG